MILKNNEIIVDMCLTVYNTIIKLIGVAVTVCVTKAENAYIQRATSRNLLFSIIVFATD